MNFFQRMKAKKGFTLIELLVVIAIIGLLATLAVVALNNARTKSRDAKRVSDIKQIQTAAELFFVDNNGYPDICGVAGPTILGAGAPLACGSFAPDTISSAGITQTAVAPTYMGLVPSDPSADGATICTGTSSAVCDYSYEQITSGTQYEIFFFLEGVTGGLQAGVNCASGNGIVSGATCA